MTFLSVTFFLYNLFAARLMQKILCSSAAPPMYFDSCLIDPTSFQNDHDKISIDSQSDALTVTPFFITIIRLPHASSTDSPMHFFIQHHHHRRCDVKERKFKSVAMLKKY